MTAIGSASAPSPRRVEIDRQLAAAGWLLQQCLRHHELAADPDRGAGRAGGRPAGLDGAADARDLDARPADRGRARLDLLSTAGVRHHEFDERRRGSERRRAPHRPVAPNHKRRGFPRPLDRAGWRVVAAGYLTVSNQLRPVIEPEAGPPAGSVAVLPFADLSSDPDDEYLSDGIHGEILTQLSKLATSASSAAHR